MISSKLRERTINFSLVISLLAVIASCFRYSDLAVAVWAISSICMIIVLPISLKLRLAYFGPILIMSGAYFILGLFIY